MKRSNFQPLSEVLDEFFKKNGIEDKIIEAQIKDSWNTVVGPMFANATKQIRISKGTLTVHMQSSAVKQEILLHRTIIMTRLNKIVKKPYIREIIVT